MPHKNYAKDLILYLIPSIFLALLFSKSLPDILMVIMGAAFLYYSYTEKSWGWVKDPVVILAFMLSAYCLLIASPFADRPFDTAVKSLIWLRFILFYACLVHVLPQSTDRLKMPLQLCLAIFAIVIVDSFFQYISGVSLSGNLKPGDRLTSFLDRPNIGTYLFKSVFAVAGLFLAVWLSGRSVRMRDAVIFYSIWFLTAVIILLSGERTATVMMLGSVFVLIPGALFFSPRRRIWAITLVASAVFVVSLVAFTQPVVKKRSGDFQKHISEFRNSPYGHLTFAALSIAKDNPLTGIGFKTFEENCKSRIDPDGNKKLCHIHPHNPYLEWMVIAGFPGMLLYFALVFALLFNVLRVCWTDNRLIVSSVALSALSMSLFPFLFSQSLVSNWPGVLAWLSIGLAVASVKIIRADCADAPVAPRN